jgi:hypothetical protein
MVYDRGFRANVKDKRSGVKELGFRVWGLGFRV